LIAGRWSGRAAHSGHADLVGEELDDQLPEVEALGVRQLAQSCVE
jgi:hypothetical protein